MRKNVSQAAEVAQHVNMRIRGSYISVSYNEEEQAAAAASTAAASISQLTHSLIPGNC